MCSSDLAQNALHHITQSLLRLMAPILSFTAEEAWTLVAPGSESVFLETWHRIPEVAGADALLDRWGLVRQVRAEVQKELEALREQGKIGSPLQAEVSLALVGERYDALAALGDDLKFVLVTSGANVTRVADGGSERIIARASSNRKCDRCWHWRQDVGTNASHPGLCGRCLSNLFGAGEKRQVA